MKRLFDKSGCLSLWGLLADSSRLESRSSCPGGSVTEVDNVNVNVNFYSASIGMNSPNVLRVM